MFLQKVSFKNLDHLVKFVICKINTTLKIHIDFQSVRELKRTHYAVEIKESRVSITTV